MSTAESGPGTHPDASPQTFRDTALDTVAVEPAPRSSRRAGFAGAVGTLIEGYDFSMYGYMSVFLAPVFFPSYDDTTGLLLTLTVFAASYVMRPLGGIVFGHLGDRVSRRSTLMATLLLMGTSSALIGILPTHATLGVWATVALVALRLLQGLSVGGEVAGAATFVSEATSSRRKGRYGALTPMGATLGFAVASGTAGLVSALTTDDQMQQWGWRIPFLVAVPLTVLCFLLRRNLSAAHEVPRAARAAGRPPLLEVLSRHPGTVLQAALLSVAVNGTAYFGLSYLSVHMIKQIGYDTSTVFWITFGVVVVAALLMPVAGRLADRIGLVNLGFVGVLGYLVLAVPGLVLVNRGSVPLAVLGFLLIVLNTTATQVTGYALSPQLFAPAVRYTGMALGWNVGVLLAGGTAPVLCVWLVEATGSLVAPAFFVVGCAVVGTLTLLTVRRRTLPGA